MSLQTYIQADQTLPAWALLQQWYQDFSGDPVHEWVRRNIDRECQRKDIDPAAWAEFLRKIADDDISSGSLDAIDRILKRDNPHRSRFVLAGRSLPNPDHDLYRYVRLDVLRLNIHPEIAAVLPGINRLAEAIADGSINGTALERSSIGRAGSPTWCTGGELRAEQSGDVVRDKLGLKDIEFGRIVEIAYSPNLLRRNGIELKAPTVLDASADGAGNWVWVKNKSAGGGPDWGYTVDMSAGGAGARGCAEAVHSPFSVPAGSGSSVRLRVLDPIQSSPRGMEYRLMMNNAAL